MNINLLFSILGPVLNEAESAFFQRFGQWVVLNERNGRLLVDGVGDESAIDSALAVLDAFGRAPRVIGGWRMDGSPLESHPLNETAYLDVGPEDAIAFEDRHRWAGWEPKQWN